MPDNPHIHYVHSHASEIAEQNAFMRAVVRKAMEILRAPIPDTFLGRKTQDPFPKEDEADMAQ
ncbi:hypothetical protein JQ596_38580 [Bradyrhizobium manausense]|uniref:hypothetical protein n=1 Tax=Bradyrhizobium manausense TaxID=989370 RepID=UPI001BA4EBC7|nr:hypothetical protein [Bradyrhizobium manausense]MBR0831428.1 hypothetical protein [Bradyrhizobium manausense]